MLRRALKLAPAGGGAVLAAAYEELGRSCEEIDGGGGCATVAYRAAASLWRGEAEEATAEEAEPRARVRRSRLSATCEHISADDAAFILPYAAPLLAPTAADPSGANAWRRLFNRAPPSVARPAGRHRGKVFGVGLSKTGVTSLRQALVKLGWARTSAMNLSLFETLDALPANLSRLGPKDPLARPLRRFLKEIDASTDLPLALFTPELLALYPDALFVLTTRPPDEWYPSAERQMATDYGADHPIHWNRALAYGAPRPHPLLYTKAFVAHALAVMRTVPCERLLLMDIVGGGGGYRELGAFLRVTPPNEPFPDLKPPPTTDKVRVFDVL